MNSRAAGKVCPTNLLKVARRKLDLLNAARVLTDLKESPQNELEKLEKAGKGSTPSGSTISIGCAIWTGAGPEQVEITDYH